MTVPVAVACTTDQHELGEGARWDARRGELLRVDILAGRIHRDRVADDGSLVPVRTYDHAKECYAFVQVKHHRFDLVGEADKPFACWPVTPVRTLILGMAPTRPPRPTHP